MSPFAESRTRKEQTDIGEGAGWRIKLESRRGANIAYKCIAIVPVSRLAILKGKTQGLARNGHWLGSSWRRVKKSGQNGGSKREKKRHNFLLEILKKRRGLAFYRRYPFNRIGIFFKRRSADVKMDVLARL